MSFDAYWLDPRFLLKRPVPNGSLKLLYGDNIYHHGEKDRWCQADSHHSRPGGIRHLPNLERDTSVDRVLIADRFVYYGGDAIDIPQRFRAWGTPPVDVCIARQGHAVASGPLAAAFVRWLLKRPVGLVGFPAEHASHPSQPRAKAAS